MHTYRIKEGDNSVYEVGFWLVATTFHTWMVVKELPTEREAAEYVNYLNGGVGHRTIDVNAYIMEA